MPALFPKPPFIPAANQHLVPACEWVMPAKARSRREHFSLYRILPQGKPDYLDVSISYASEGTERTTAAVYGNKAYLIHYEFKAHTDKPA